MPWNAMDDEVHGVGAGYLLLLEEIRGVAFTFGEDVRKEFRAGHCRAAEPLCLDHRTLHHALKASGRTGVAVVVDHQSFQLVVDVGGEILC